GRLPIMNSPILVQKYGGSVLANDASFARAAREIASAVRAGRRVVAVVSAVRGLTDALIERGRQAGSRSIGPTLDLLLASGELQSSALLGLALEAEDIPAEALNPWQI